MFGYKIVKEKVKRDPLRFSKKIMYISFAFLTLYVAASFLLAYRSMTTLDSQLTICVFAFWGTECFSNAWIKVTELKHKESEEKKDGMVNE
ncbi:hypothetical protein [Dielma fastidiosa]|uniref:Uncharacterized protein n=1 Tax=Dielma fastidiosa TaxID=1034346 RepID=A0A318KSB0_9FIRM|nr:hypothetical protein [Dielma fastidiosa]PXX79718.1 hypothetical protein DES51_105192 [Dielma fastidiosa]